MTDTMMTHPAGRGFARWLRLWLCRPPRRAPEVRLDTLSDHTLRDIGLRRDQTAGTPINSLHDAMRFSG